MDGSTFSFRADRARHFELAVFVPVVPMFVFEAVFVEVAVVADAVAVVVAVRIGHEGKIVVVPFYDCLTFAGKEFEVYGVR